MKRLRYECPFRGKIYPFILGLALPLAAGFAADRLRLSTFFVFLAVAVTLAVTIGVCFLIEQRVSAEEKRKIAQSELPLWHEVTPRELLFLKPEPKPANKLIIALCVIAGLCAGLLIWRGGSSIAVVLICALAVSYLLYALAKKREAAEWEEMDGTAVALDVKVDHCIRRGGNIYPVFYLPDGRYILDGRGRLTNEPETVTLVRFRDLCRWEALPENTDETGPDNKPAGTDNQSDEEKGEEREDAESTARENRGADA